MGGSAKVPKESDEQRRQMRLQEELMKQQLEDAKNPAKLPDITPPKPIPPPPPPVSGGSDDVAQAEDIARQRALRRINSSRGTLFAGETGGYRGGSLGGQKTLLG